MVLQVNQINTILNSEIIEKHTAPYFPASNGQAERFFKTIKNAVPAKLGGNLHFIIYNFLLQYQKALHCAIGIYASDLIGSSKTNYH